ncbi:D-xylose 1-dehydrogenase Gfo6 [Natronolimnobius baerhuensis]|uniref:Glucose-fructose oxidoreductase n=1 Tax=Natronolimnobius baerhuensis TaxID=253108 RepID=A0A202E8U1_9EURY|nr:D-xylose 1-dehydrogenase Gfo6 [Natronolimnobius baerhuensis]OVE84685.1 glucose-fructose oxidoreductase [Natronolimnobius baerhuensis]
MEPNAFQTYLDSFTDREWQVSDDEDGPVRFALIGLGWWTADKAIPAINNSTFCKATVAASSSKEKAEQFVDDHDTLEHGLTYDELQDGVATDAYDAVYICTPNARHQTFVESAVAHEKAILCEKPMEATLEAAESIVEDCADLEAPAMIAYRMHTEPVVQRARELVREGAIGEPVHVHGNMSQSIVGWGENQWRLDPEMAGRGTSVTDLGIYPLNTTRFILEREPVAVQAMMDSSHEYFEDVPDEVAAFTITLEGGVCVSCTASQHSQLDSFLRIVGTEGRITIEPAFHSESSLQLTRANTTVDIDTPQVDQMEEEFDYFADCVLDGREPAATPEHGYVDMQVIEAVYDAAERGETITL